MRGRAAARPNFAVNSRFGRVHVYMHHLRASTKVWSLSQNGASKDAPYVRGTLLRAKRITMTQLTHFLRKIALNESDLATALVASIDSDKLTKAFAEIGDTGVSAFLESGALEGVPIFGGLAKIYNGVEAVGVYLFRKKVANFVFGLANTSTDERRRFIGSFNSEAEKRELGETVLYLLTSIDDSKKAQICGHIFSAAVQEKCALEVAFRTISSVKGAFTPDFAHFARCYDAKTVTGSSGQIEVPQHVAGDDEASARVVFEAFTTNGWTGISLPHVDEDGPNAMFGFHVKEIGHLLRQFGLRALF